jgi:hypothetical protein
MSFDFRPTKGHMSCVFVCGLLVCLFRQLAIYKQTKERIPAAERLDLRTLTAGGICNATAESLRRTRWQDFGDQCRAGRRGSVDTAR